MWRGGERIGSDILECVYVEEWREDMFGHTSMYVCTIKLDVNLKYEINLGSIYLRRKRGKLVYFLYCFLVCCLTFS